MAAPDSMSTSVNLSSTDSNKNDDACQAVELYDEEIILGEEVTWKDVFNSCCVHSREGWARCILGLSLVLLCLYFFLLGIELLATSAKVLSGCTAGEILGDSTNPVSAMMIGLVAAALIQSSSTVSSIAVALTGSGISIQSAIYIIMGANMGTSITNTIVSIGQIGNSDQFERAFAGATVHDMFNLLTIAVLLPLEVATQYLKRLTGAILPNDVDKGEKWQGPLKKVVSPLAARIILVNKNISKELATDEDNSLSCGDFYPVKCVGEPNYANCHKAEGSKVGLISCDKLTGKCPAFFMNGATESDDKVSAGVCVFLALVILVVSLISLVKLMQKILSGVPEKVVRKALSLNGREWVGIFIGAGLTMIVQSSSIVTSILTPLVGLDLITLEQMYPLTIGANIGTTLTAIMAALVSDKVVSLQAALAHFFFNVTGALLWYPLPCQRNVPLSMARQMGKATRAFRFFPAVYIGTVFFLLPGIIIGISTLFEKSSRGFTALGVFSVLLLAMAIVYSCFWWNYKDGKRAFVLYVENRQERSRLFKSLPSEIETLKAAISRLETANCYVAKDIENGDETNKPLDEPTSEYLE